MQLGHGSLTHPIQCYQGRSPSPQPQGGEQFPSRWCPRDGSLGPSTSGGPHLPVGVLGVGLQGHVGAVLVVVDAHGIGGQLDGVRAHLRPLQLLLRHTLTLHLRACRDGGTVRQGDTGMGLRSGAGAGARGGGHGVRGWRTGGQDWDEDRTWGWDIGMGMGNGAGRLEQG